MINETCLVLITISLLVSTIIGHLNLVQLIKSNDNFERIHKLNLEAQIMNKRHLAMAEEANLREKNFVQKQLELREAELELFKPTKTETK